MSTLCSSAVWSNPMQLSGVEQSYAARRCGATPCSSAVWSNPMQLSGARQPYEAQRRTPHEALWREATP